MYPCSVLVGWKKQSYVNVLASLVTAWYFGDYTHRLLFFCEYKGHAINELWQQISPKFGSLIEGGLLYVITQIVELWCGGPCGAPKYWRVQKIVTLFSYIVWPSAMKFGVIRGLANWHLFPEFRELWSGGHSKPCRSAKFQTVCF